jgi:serine/threonine-protein kinase
MESGAAELVGQTIAGRYRVLRLVGEGGVGRVYEAEQVLGSSPRSVALKLLRPEWSHDAAVQARFHREAALVAKLQHVNTVRIYDFGATADGTLYIAMEFLRGRSLQRLLDERGALPPERVDRIVGQVAASLQEAHDVGIIHRDLKPDNILILDGHGSEHDMVKLLDFGIAKGRPSSGSALTKLTALGTFVGTPAYMSPEQFGAGAIGPESDIYSLGVTSHQMLAGRLPFDAQSAMQWAQAHLGSAAPALAADCGAGPIPESMRRAVLHALAKEPSQRPASARQFAREFSGAEAPALVAEGPAPPAVHPASRVAAIEPSRADARRAPVAFAPAPVAPAAVAGGPRTAPMTRVPDFVANAVAPTLPIPSPVPPRPEAPRAPRRGGAVKLLIGATSVLGAAFIAVLGQQLGWFSASGGGPPAPEDPGLSAAPPPVVIAPEPAPVTPESPSRSSEPSPPVERGPSPKPAPPRATPPVPPATRPPAPGTPPAPAPGVPPILPGPSTPAPAPSTPASPQLPPGVLPPGVQLPDLQLPPINLPSAAGACERCLETLSKGGNGSVVSAAADDLLCNDRQGSQACEAQIRELAPTVAEQAARAGDCPAALATEAAGLRLGVDQARFGTVHTLCVR